MRRVVTVLALVSLFVGSPTDVALADIVYTDTGFDPDDARPGIADVSFTRRTVFTNENGRRFIRVKVRAHEPLGPIWSGLWVLLDSRGGPRRDARMAFSNGEGPPFCGLNFPDGSGWIFPARQEGRTISCVFRLGLLNPTKRIRWRVLSPPPDAFDSPDFDTAPDSGWYV